MRYLKKYQQVILRTVLAAAKFVLISLINNLGSTQMYLRKQFYKEDLSAGNHSSKEEDNSQVLFNMILFALILIFTVLLSSLSEIEFKLM